jgi:hypothetical protein
MFNAQRYLPAVFAAVVLTAAPACASYGYVYQRPGYSRVDDRAHRNGYDRGRRYGEEDARRGRRPEYDRHDDYRDADNGYRGGSRDVYRQAFRQGFVEGYNDGYRRYARDGRPGRPPIFERPGPGPVYSSPAASIGFRDGFAQGREDARDRRRFDPVRASRYRSADHEYNNRYGSRDDYRRDYRAAFEQGYEQGYRGARR